MLEILDLKWRALCICLVSFCLCVFSTNISAKPIDEYWRDLGLSFDLLRPLQHGTCNDPSPLNLCVDCSQNKQSFRACIAAYNSLLRQLPTPLELAPAGEFVGHPTFGSVVLVPAGAKLDLNTKFDIEQTRSFRAQLNYERGLFKDRWNLFFQKGLEPQIQYQELQNLIEKEVIAKAGADSPVLIANAFNAYLAVRFDSHHRLYPREKMDDERLASKLRVSVGLVLARSQNRIEIAEVIESTSAFAEGIKPHDTIMSIDGKDVRLYPVIYVANLLEGAPGTEVNLVIERNGTLYPFRLRRGEQTSPITSRLDTTGNRKVGVIVIPGFKDDKICTDTATAISNLTKQKAEALVLDLRNNWGGFVSLANCVLGLFIERGQISMKEQQADGNVDYQVVTGLPGVKKTNLPLVILVDRETASSAEIVAGNLQAYERGFVVGSQTFGKGLSHIMERLPLDWTTNDSKEDDLWWVRAHSQFFFVGARKDIYSPHLVGITPDFRVQTAPDLTEEDQTGTREIDFLGDSELPPKTWIQPRATEVKTLQSCVDQTGQSLKRFQPGSTDSTAGDFQLLTALDVLNCQLPRGHASLP